MSRRSGRGRGSGLGALFRFLAGLPLSRHAPRSNATFFCRGTDGPPGWFGRGGPSRWTMLAGWQRSAFRLVPLAVAAGLHFDPVMTEWAATLAGGPLAGFLGWRAWRNWHAEPLIRSMAVALGPLIELPEIEARRAIALRPGYAEIRKGEIGAITLPDGYRAGKDQRPALEHLISSRLPVDVDCSWRTSGHPQRVLLLAAPQCPSMVRFADLAGEMAACKPGQVVIGLDRHSDVFHGSFLIDDPHWGFSVGSGRGKSTFLCATGAQVLHQDPGATVDGIDPKMSSLDALIGVPGVTVANDPRNIRGMWDVIDGYYKRMMDRLDQLKADPTLTFPVALLVLDEINTFAAMSSAHWRQVKAKEDPLTPPVWFVLAQIHWMGRQVNCHCISVGQRLDDKATGNIGLRTSMGFVGIAGFRGKEWDLLIGTRPVPRSQKPKGRWLYDDGSNQTWAQNVVNIREGETEPDPGIIRDYAMAGRRQGVPARPGQGLSPVAMAPVGTGTWVVGLDAGAAFLGLPMETFKKRRQRAGGKLAGELRQGSQPAWTEADLTAFAAGDVMPLPLH